MARLNLENGELIEMCTYDNRHLSMKCTKYHEGEPTVDLLPRIRYWLRIDAAQSAARVRSSSQLFFNSGLIVIPEEPLDGAIQRVAVMNLSEKAVRVWRGLELGVPEWEKGAMSQSSSGSGTPKSARKERWDESETASQGIGRANSFYVEETIPQLLRSA